MLRLVPSKGARSLLARSSLSHTPVRAIALGTKRVITEVGYTIPSYSFSRSFHATTLNLGETIKVPAMAESITEGTLKQWIKKKGDYVEADEEVATIETDKIDIAVNAPMSGTITDILAQEEDTVTVGQDLFVIEAGAAPEGGASKEAEPAPKEEAAPAKAEEKTPEPKKEESKAPAPKEEAPKAAAKPAPKPAAPRKEEAPKKVGEGPNRTETRVKMSRMRQRIAERLKQSQNAAASLTTFNEIDMSSLMAMRSKYKDDVLKTHGVKLGFMSAFAKAACIALKEIPAANASIEGEGNGEQIVYRDYVDLSVAVATPKGLVTPVVRNCESMSFVEIEQAIVDLGKKARDNKLTLEDMAGGSFTISNGGVFGSLYGTPIINVPQCAVLGMHSIKDRAVVVDGKIVIRPIMVVALTYDHRLLDGREGVTFLVRIKNLIEDPRLMLYTIYQSEHVPFRSCLVGYQAAFHTPPSSHARVKDCLFLLSFHGASGGPSPVIKGIAPSSSTGMTLLGLPLTVTRERSITSNIQIGYDPYASASISATTGKTFAHDGSAKIVVSGIETTKALITVAEDESRLVGIPSSFDFAVLLHLPEHPEHASDVGELHPNAFEVEVSVEASLARGGVQESWQRFLGSPREW
ncbi:2-oxoglutarate dehydrogenase E2 component (dihydrolipoamide succinyltransferase), partial [Phenoliferia sp. Uapishka_3]